MISGESGLDRAHLSLTQKNAGWVTANTVYLMGHILGYGAKSRA